MLQPERTLLITCAAVAEEIRPDLPAGMKMQTLEFGLHVSPEKLHAVLQTTIDAVDADIDTILLGYGLCSQATMGVGSVRCTLVVPRVDDCISIFLGSRAAYQAQARAMPGTYYLTKGWIEVGTTPFSEYEAMVQRWGAARAARVQKLMLKNYSRLALIDTGQYAIDGYREYSRQMATQFDLHYEEIPGSNALVQKLLSGEWDDEFVVVPPGEKVRYEQFFPSLDCA